MVPCCIVGTCTLCGTGPPPVDSRATRNFAPTLATHKLTHTLNPSPPAGHPGWAIYPVDSEQFMSTGALESVSLPTPDHLHAASPMVPPSPTALPGGWAGGWYNGCIGSTVHGRADAVGA